MAVIRRKYDDPKYRNWFRSNRMFEDNDKWFFFTREKTIEGPYGSQSEANIGMEVYIANVTCGLPSANCELTQAS